MRKARFSEEQTSTPGLRVRCVLYRLAARGCPEKIHVDNGPEFLSRSVNTWCEQRDVLMWHIEPGKPAQNGHIEWFNGLIRDECLTPNWFINLQHAGERLPVGDAITTNFGYIAPWHIELHSSLRGTLPFALPTFDTTDRSRPQDSPDGALTCGLHAIRDLPNSQQQLGTETGVRCVPLCCAVLILHQARYGGEVATEV